MLKMTIVTLPKPMMTLMTLQVSLSMMMPPHSMPLPSTSPTKLTQYQHQQPTDKSSPMLVTMTSPTQMTMLTRTTTIEARTQLMPLQESACPEQPLMPMTLMQSLPITPNVCQDHTVPMLVSLRLLDFDRHLQKLDNLQKQLQHISNTMHQLIVTLDNIPLVLLTPNQNPSKTSPPLSNHHHANPSIWICQPSVKTLPASLPTLNSPKSPLLSCPALGHQLNLQHKPHTSQQLALALLQFAENNYWPL